MKDHILNLLTLSLYLHTSLLDSAFHNIRGQDKEAVERRIL
jgi:hypothetical protein